VAWLLLLAPRAHCTSCCQPPPHSPGHLSWLQLLLALQRLASLHQLPHPHQQQTACACEHALTAGSRLLLLRQAPWLLTSAREQAQPQPPQVLQQQTARWLPLQLLLLHQRPLLCCCQAPCLSVCAACPCCQQHHHQQQRQQQAQEGRPLQVRLHQPLQHSCGCAC
jgi:hypothetical protein